MSLLIVFSLPLTFHKRRGQTAGKRLLQRPLCAFSHASSGCGPKHGLQHVQAWPAIARARGGERANTLPNPTTTSPVERGWDGGGGYDGRDDDGEKAALPTARRRVASCLVHVNISLFCVFFASQWPLWWRRGWVSSQRLSRTPRQISEAKRTKLASVEISSMEHLEC